MLWAHGLLSAVMIRELADLAIADGASHPDLVALAPTGNWGAQTGNCNRQILNAFCPQVHLPEPFQIKVGCIDPKTSLEKEDMASVFLPHLQFYMLAEHYPSYFHELFSLGKGDLEKFWAGVEKSGDDKIINHPMCLEKHWRETTIPLFIHGGGVEFQSRDSLLVFSWGGVLGKGTSLKHHQLMAMWPKSCCTASTWGPIWQYLKWSFEALGKGLHPSKDPLGNPLEKGSIFYELQGKPLHAKGFRAYVWNIMGDHEFFSNVLGLPHWAGHFPCWECDSENWEGCNPDKHFKQICLEKQKFEVTSHQDQMADPWSDHPIFQLPHLSCKNARGDPMHILFCKGLYQQLIGGILHYALLRRTWKGHFKEALGKACFAIFSSPRGIQGPELRQPNDQFEVIYAYQSQEAMGCKSMLGVQGRWSQTPALCIGPSLGKDLGREYAWTGNKNDICSIKLGKACQALGWSSHIPQGLWI